ncbi:MULTISPECIES: alpha/beta hydrolase [Rhodomicrobium]|uniref:alpha/beta fold hydrolase n=1 Tax=Rhodomicrobium TaxID=1068 RepID=UPI000B4B6A32|nr:MULTISPECIES: alpha/beta hydrolase [Rhodomicrobium]
MAVTQFETPTLSIGCEISGPEAGSSVMLLHGWPDDARTWDGVLPALHAAGHRTYVPYLRGYGPTRFRDAATMRSGQLAALGQDVIELADALGLSRFAVIGHDWGARAAYIASALAPERIGFCVAISVGWGTNDPDQVLPLKQVQNYWYHWYIALDRGADLLRNDRAAFTRYIWEIWNPNWRFPDAVFAETARSFENPDWADVVLHSYRVRWGHAEGDPRYAGIEARLRADPTIAVPTLMIHGGGDPCNDPASSAGKEGLFSGPYERVVLDRIGHFPQREAPQAVAAAILRHLRIE